MKAASAAFVKAQREFLSATKGSTNPQFNSKYADLSACLDAVLPALHKNGFALLQETSECDSGVVVETLFIHESGEVIRGGKLHVPAAKENPQGYGSALSYCRRYSLSTAAGLRTADDDGEAASKEPVKKIKGFTERDRTALLLGLTTAPDVKTLKERFTSAYTIVQEMGDDALLKAVIAEKDSRKVELDAFEPEAARVGV